jgi:hypothetical protein
MTKTYEQVRDSATGEAGAAWKSADRETARLTELYHKLKNDPRYTEQHKVQKAWQTYETKKDKIVGDRAKAKEHLHKQASTSTRLSIPFPEGEGPIIVDTSKLLASQNEANRVVRKLDRLDKNRKGPFTPDRAEILRQEYQRGLDTGGMQDGAICRGVLSACDELGIDVDVVVDSFRTERHRENLERAQHASRLTQLIGKQVSEPPFPNPSAPGRSRVPGKRSKALLVDRGRQVRAPGRRSSGAKRSPKK